MRDLRSYVDDQYRNAPEEAMRLYHRKTVDETFPHVLENQLESRLKKLEASRQAMLREHSGSISNIQNGAISFGRNG